jgi:hypothetical protein
VADPCEHRNESSGFKGGAELPELLRGGGGGQATAP